MGLVQASLQLSVHRWGLVPSAAPHARTRAVGSGRWLLFWTAKAHLIMFANDAYISRRQSKSLIKIKISRRYAIGDNYKRQCVKQEAHWPTTITGYQRYWQCTAVGEPHVAASHVELTHIEGSDDVCIDGTLHAQYPFKAWFTLYIASKRYVTLYF